jgi:hypothetical protein
MAAVYMDHGFYWLLREGAGTLLWGIYDLICDATPAARVFELRLAKNDIDLFCNMSLADFTEADFTGYAPVSLETPCAGLLEAPGTDVGGEWLIPLDQQIFTQSGTGTTNTIYGAYIVEIGSNRVVWARDFPSAPFPMDATGNQIKITGELRMKCQSSF